MLSQNNILIIIALVIAYLLFFRNENFASNSSKLTVANSCKWYEMTKQPYTNKCKNSKGETRCYRCKCGQDSC